MKVEKPLSDLQRIKIALCLIDIQEIKKTMLDTKCVTFRVDLNVENELEKFSTDDLRFAFQHLNVRNHVEMFESFFITVCSFVSWIIKSKLSVFQLLSTSTEKLKLKNHDFTYGTAEHE